MFRFSIKSVTLQIAMALPLMLAIFFGATHARAADDYLEPEAAFKFSARMLDPQTIAVTYDIADGYYMYRERFKFSAIGAKLGTPDIPPGKIKFDETFQKNEETYRQSITIKIPVDANGMFTLNATGQGCADQGLCYAPQETQVRLVGAAPAASDAASAPVSPSAGVHTDAGTPVAGVAALTAPVASAIAHVPSADSASVPEAAVPTPTAKAAVLASAIALPATTPNSSAVAPVDPASTSWYRAVQSGTAVLSQARLILIIPAFILLGLGLAFTPCVLPMVPILSSIIVGEGASVTRSRGFALSLAYTLGVAIVYTALGVTAALIGPGLQAALQNPWVLVGFGLLIVGLAMSMFGYYELQVPATLQTKLVQLSGRQTSGKLVGVFVMGAISALILGPCVTAPLSGALVFIGQTGDVVIGASALFALALGMCIPLLLIGVSAGTLLPRAGAWMNEVKRFFGVLMLAMALWLVSPVLPALVQMLGWTALGLSYGLFMLRKSRHWAALAVGAAFALLGAVELVGIASGGRDALAPLARLLGTEQHGLAFTRVKTIAQLDAALAGTGGKTAILDFYADWCVSCKEMEKLTFIDTKVKGQLANSVLLQVDVTANDADDKAMLKRFHLFGPPGIILFDRSGREIDDGRVIGYQNPEKFLASLGRLQ